jgi:uncharacterized repeat protein (TIGR01451 family)
VTPVNPSANVYGWSLPDDLAPGESTAFTLRARVAVSLPNGATTLLNYVTLTAASPDRDRTNNEVSDVDTVTAYPDLTLGKSYTATGAVVAGSVVTYQLSGANIGYATAGGVTVVDVMDARVEYIDGTATVAISDGAPVAITPITGAGYLTFTLPDLPHDYTYFVTYAVTVSATGGTPLINTATISTTAQDTNLANNSGSIAIPTEQSIDAYVQKSAVASANPAIPGSRIVYTIIYGNNGADAAPDVLLTDPLPPDTTLVADSITGGGVFVTATNSISWTWPSLASQSTGTVRFTVQISTPLPAGVDALVNTASITFTSTITDVLPNNNTSSVSTPVDAQPDLTLVKSDGRTQVLAGDLLTYTSPIPTPATRPPAACDHRHAGGRAGVCGFHAGRAGQHRDLHRNVGHWRPAGERSAHADRHGAGPGGCAARIGGGQPRHRRRRPRQRRGHQPCGQHLH